VPADVVETRSVVPGPEDRSAVLSWGEQHGALLMQSAAIDAEGAHTRLLDILDGAQSGGTVGFLVRQIDGPTVLAHNEDFVFEPASTIKALTHFHAMRQVQDGATIDADVVTLQRPIPWFRGPSNYSNSPESGETSCPDLTDETQDALSFVLQTMMVDSDNRTTQAARTFFGEAEIDATRSSLGMASSRHVHMIGCGSLATANPNWLTLADAGRLYEAAATTYLDDATRQAAFDVMARDVGLFNGITDQEADGLGITAGRLTEFADNRDAALKAGSYNVDGKRYRSVAGWSSVPFRNATCAMDPREYVWGTFVHDADTFDDNSSIRVIGSETLRETIRAALETWAECQADLEVNAVEVLDLDDPLYVNQQADFTVRVNVGNAGPASSANAVLFVSATAPPDCSYDAAQQTVPVDDLADDETRNVDVAFTVTCTGPSDHQFGITASVAPELADMLDPVNGNNSMAVAVQREMIAYADLGITAWDFSELDAAVIGDFVVGQDFDFSATQTLRNLGDTELGLYHDPAETYITRSLIVPEGIRASITVAPEEAPASVIIQRDGQPDEVTDGVLALTTVAVDGAAVITVVSTASIAVQQTLDIAGPWTLRCLEPGDYDLDFGGSISAVDPHLLDPEVDDNTMDVSRTIDCAVPVQLNIRPANKFNQVDPASDEVVPSAVLTTVAGEYGLPLAFDATSIDPSSVRFGTVPVLTAGAGGTVHQHFVRDSFEMDDRTRDGDDDRVLSFNIVGTGIMPHTTELHVVGRFQGAGGTWYTFVGRDAIQVQGS
jgi:hypothetical protein